MGTKSFREEITLLFTGIAERIFRNPDIFTLISAQHASLFKGLSQEKRNEFVKTHDEIWGNLKKRITKAIEDNELRNIQPEAIVGLIHGSLDAMVLNRWDCETLDELKNGINIFIDMVFNGIAKK